MDLQFLLATLVGKTILTLLKSQKRGGTALPGLWALKIDPQFVRKASKELKTIVITGTNGKTTTSRLIAAMLETNGAKVIHNRSGSNLLRGVASTFLADTKAEWAVIEADEAAFTQIVHQTNPKIVLLLNLFRDQMDRYGEIDGTAKRWGEALANNNAAVILNADDPSLARIATKLKNSVTFGLDDPSQSLKKLPHAVDSIFSPETGEPLHYSSIFLSHLGIYEDKKSSFKRPPLDISIPVVISNSLTKTKFKVKTKNETFELESILPGTFNIYNIEAATAAALTAQVPTEKISEAVKNFQSVFGRTERLKIGAADITLFLIKNPVGFDQIIELLKSDTEPFELCIGINDNYADGTDISWLWDVDIEGLPDTIKYITTTGTRANEMALRLKYANIPDKIISVEPNLENLLAEILKNKEVSRGHFLLTYTAMLEFRALLTEKGFVKPFYED